MSGGLVAVLLEDKDLNFLADLHAVVSVALLRDEEVTLIHSEGVAYGFGPSPIVCDEALPRPSVEGPGPPARR